MPYIIEKLEDQVVDAISKPESWVQRDPVLYGGMFDALSDMRGHEEQGARIKTPDWKLVAKLQVPLEGAARVMHPDFLKDKRKFYSWLDRNPRYCAYDRRRGPNREALGLVHGWRPEAPNGIPEHGTQADPKA